MLLINLNKSFLGLLVPSHFGRQSYISLKKSHKTCLKSSHHPWELGLGQSLVPVVASDNVRLHCMAVPSGEGRGQKAMCSDPWLWLSRGKHGKDFYHTNLFK